MRRAWYYYLYLQFAAIAVIAGTAGSIPAFADEGNGLCELTVEGRDIRNITLIERGGGAGRVLPYPGGKTARLPAGTYRVVSYELTGDQFAPAVWPRSDEPWFELKPDAPHTLVIGPPLYPTVEVTRQGRSLKIEYRIVDGAGRHYIDQRTDRFGRERPKVSIFRGEQLVHSGQFEYG